MMKNPAINMRQQQQQIVRPSNEMSRSSSLHQHADTEPEVPRDSTASLDWRWLKDIVLSASSQWKTLSINEYAARLPSRSYCQDRKYRLLNHLGSENVWYALLTTEEALTILWVSLKSPTAISSHPQGVSHAVTATLSSPPINLAKLLRLSSEWNLSLGPIVAALSYLTIHQCMPKVDAHRKQLVTVPISLSVVEMVLTSLFQHASVKQQMQFCSEKWRWRLVLVRIYRMVHHVQAFISGSNPHLASDVSCCESRCSGSSEGGGGGDRGRDNGG